MGAARIERPLWCDARGLGLPLSSANHLDLCVACNPSAVVGHSSGQGWPRNCRCIQWWI